MSIHLELIADTPAELANVTALYDNRDAKVELTGEGDLYVSIDLRDSSVATPSTPPRDDVSGLIDSESREAHLVRGEAGYPGPRDGTPDDAGPDPVPWAPIAHDQLIDLGRANARPTPIDGDRVVHIGELWPVNGPARRYAAPGAPIAHVIATTGDTAILQLPDGSESTMHADRLAVVEQVNASGHAIIVLGDYPDVEHDGHTVDVGVPDTVDGEPHVPVDPDPESEPEPAAEDGPERPRPGTCQAAILEAVERFPDNTWSITDIVTAVTADGFTAGTVKVSISPLVAAGWLYRPEPGKHRLRGH